MKKKLSLVFMILAVVLSAISYVLLPDSVVIQIGADGQPSSVVPKLLAILIAFGITVAGSLFNYGSDEIRDHKGLIMAVVGIVVFLFLLVVNMILKV